MDNNKFDIIIIGSGYRALVTAYLALKKKKENFNYFEVKKFTWDNEPYYMARWRV